jgi:hypothetical protein
MDIKEFLEQSIGNWFSLRTAYQLNKGETENSKSEISLEILLPEHPEVISLCQEYNLDPNLSLGGQKTTWDNSVDWGKPKQKGSVIIVLIPNENDWQVGKLLRKAEKAQAKNTLGRYSLAKDDSLTLIIESDNIYSEERISFASPNLRLRTTATKYGSNYSNTAFYSEIRRIPPKS